MTLPSANYPHFYCGVEGRQGFVCLVSGKALGACMHDRVVHVHCASIRVLARLELGTLPSLHLSVGASSVPVCYGG
jgi:hypothetical protein